MTNNKCYGQITISSWLLHYMSFSDIAPHKYMISIYFWLLYISFSNHHHIDQTRQPHLDRPNFSSIFFPRISSIVDCLCYFILECDLRWIKIFPTNRNKNSNKKTSSLFPFALSFVYHHYYKNVI